MFYYATIGQELTLKIPATVNFPTAMFVDQQWSMLEAECADDFTLYRLVVSCRTERSRSWWREAT